MDRDEARCAKCKTTRKIQGLETVTLANGSPAARGNCGVCGSKLYRILPGPRKAPTTSSSPANPSPTPVVRAVRRAERAAEKAEDAIEGARKLVERGSRNPPKPAAQPAKEQTMTANEVRVRLPAVPVMDIDDRELWVMCGGLVEGLRELGPAAQGPAALVAEAVADRARYEAGDTDDKTSTNDAKLHMMGKQMARVLGKWLLSRGLSWQAIMPPILDGRSLIQQGADFLIDNVGEPVIGTLIPDVVDPSLPSSGSGVGQTGAAEASPGVDLLQLLFELGGNAINAAATPAIV